MITINTNNERLLDEFIHVLKLFYTQSQIDSIDLEFNVVANIKDNKVFALASSSNSCKTYEKYGNISDAKFPERYVKRYAKLALYDCLRDMFPSAILPWGSLTGIRPTKLFYELIKENNGSQEKAYNQFIKDFYVTENKGKLVLRIIENQKNVVKDENIVDFYVNIPFCPSKCYYCSFISLPIEKCRDLLEPYISALCKEILSAKKLISDRGYVVRSVYIGGGTPTILSAEQLDRLLSVMDFKVSEYTVECGRPDTITNEKLQILEKYGVTRISINPQTFNEDTLRLIGRNHTSQEIFDVYKLARQYPFDINMDLIAGLGNETLDVFKCSLDTALSLKPDNLTVHTLSIKRGSLIHENGGQTSTANDVLKMINYSHDLLLNSGYEPYYLYKQKNMLGNLENIGYFLTKPSVFNIVSMEEFASIIACGANAISKRFYEKDNKIERFANLKNIPDYINRIDELIVKKNILFS